MVGNKKTVPNYISYVDVMIRNVKIYYQFYGHRETKICTSSAKTFKHPSKNFFIPKRGQEKGISEASNFGRLNCD